MGIYLLYVEEVGTDGAHDVGDSLAVHELHNAARDGTSIAVKQAQDFDLVVEALLVERLFRVVADLGFVRFHNAAARTERGNPARTHGLADAMG